MTKKQISVLSWDDALNLFPKNNPNQGFCDLITKICKQLSTSKKHYVYHAKFQFGEKLIDGGKISLNNFSVTYNTEFQVSINNLQEDLGYSEDPLGIVSKGFIEVYIENNCDSNKYRVPLNIINEGELFGLFGTLDLYTDIANTTTQRDWFVCAGNISSLIVASPFHNTNENESLDANDLKELFQRRTIEPDKWIKFINKFKKEDWRVDVIYFPNHIVKLIEKKNSGLLFKEGWKQSYALRNVLLNDPSISNKIALIDTNKLHHDKIFLNTVYNYIHKACINEAGVFIPLNDSEHLFCKSFKNFLNQGSYTENSFKVLPFTFSLLENNDFGLIPIYMLPVLYNYKIISLNKLMNDLKKISDKIEEESLKIFNRIEAYGSTGGVDDNLFGKKIGKTGEVSLTFKQQALKNKYPDIFTGITLTSKEFSNLILIKCK